MAHPDFIINEDNEIILRPAENGWDWFVRFKAEPGMILQIGWKPTIAEAFKDIQSRLKFPRGKYAKRSEPLKGNPEVVKRWRKVARETSQSIYKSRLRERRAETKKKSAKGISKPSTARSRGRVRRG